MKVKFEYSYPVRDSLTSEVKAIPNFTVANLPELLKIMQDAFLQGAKNYTLEIKSEG